MSEEQNKAPSEAQNKAPNEGEARVLSDDELKGIVGGGIVVGRAGVDMLRGVDDKFAKVAVVKACEICC